jgi:hypothetical protein
MVFPLNRILYVPRKLRFVPRARAAAAVAEADLSSADQERCLHRARAAALIAEANLFTQGMVMGLLNSDTDPDLILDTDDEHPDKLQETTCPDEKRRLRGLMSTHLNLVRRERNRAFACRALSYQYNVHLGSSITTLLADPPQTSPDGCDQSETDDELADSPRTWFPMMHQQEAKAAQDAGTLPVQGLGTWRMQMRRKAKWVRVSPERERDSRQRERNKSEREREKSKRERERERQKERERGCAPSAHMGVHRVLSDDEPPDDLNLDTDPA